ncbi:hypothetical protein [Helicobacter cetorum]|uniref:hypothetical protein n=1 Tax=Helicobacter cetorum TaxID=138563 RepID=UPI000CF17F31|nr:hypothetical protein [Helicobacter cetorum]
MSSKLEELEAELRLKEIEVKLIGDVAQPKEKGSKVIKSIGVLFGVSLIVILVIFILYKRALYKEPSAEIKSTKTQEVTRYVEEIVPADTMKTNLDNSKDELDSKLSQEYEKMNSLIDAQIDEFFNQVEKNVDSFVDWHYSLMGSYNEMFSFICGKVDKCKETFKLDDFTDKLTAKILGENYSQELEKILGGFDNQFEDLLKDYKRFVIGIATQGVDTNLSQNKEILGLVDEKIKSSIYFTIGGIITGGTVGYTAVKSGLVGKSITAVKKGAVAVKESATIATNKIMAHEGVAKGVAAVKKGAVAVKESATIATNKIMAHEGVAKGVAAVKKGLVATKSATAEGLAIATRMTPTFMKEIASKIAQKLGSKAATAFLGKVAGAMVSAGLGDYLLLKFHEFIEKDKFRQDILDNINITKEELKKEYKNEYYEKFQAVSIRMSNDLKDTLTLKATTIEEHVENLNQNTPKENEKN